MKYVPALIPAPNPNVVVVVTDAMVGQALHPTTKCSAVQNVWGCGPDGTQETLKA